MDQKTVTAKWIGPELEYEGTSTQGVNIKMGGQDGISPSELLLLGFAGCMGMDVKVVLNKKKVEVDAIEVEVTGHQPELYPKPYKIVEIKFTVHGKDIPPNAVERAIGLSRDKYCVVGQSLKEPVELKTAFEIAD